MEGTKKARLAPEHAASQAEDSGAKPTAPELPKQPMMTTSHERVPSSGEAQPDTTPTRYSRHHLATAGSQPTSTRPGNGTQYRRTQ